MPFLKIPALINNVIVSSELHPPSLTSPSLAAIIITTTTTSKAPLHPWLRLTEESVKQKLLIEGPSRVAVELQKVNQNIWTLVFVCGVGRKVRVISASWPRLQMTTNTTLPPLPTTRHSPPPTQTYTRCGRKSTSICSGSNDINH